MTLTTNVLRCCMLIGLCLASVDSEPQRKAYPTSHLRDVVYTKPAVGLMGDTATQDQMWEQYKCDDYFADTSSRPTDHTPIWNALKTLYYNEVVRHTRPHANHTHEIQHLLSKRAMNVPYQVTISPGKGLGVFSTTNIQKGHVIADYHSSGSFKLNRAADYRRLIRKADRQDMQCLVLQCSCVTSPKTPREYPRHQVVEAAQIQVDFDDWCFFNSGDRNDHPNVSQRHDRIHYHALRDIAAGEEIVDNYRDFLNVPGGWRVFGL